MEFRPLCVMLLLMELIHCILTETPTPQVTSDLKGAALTGNSVTLNCTLKPQSAGWTFNWITPRHSTETKTHSYTVSSVSVSDGGRYKCYADRTNPFKVTGHSNELRLEVIESPKPVVIIKPDTQVFIGERVTFRCDIQTGGDTEWTYKWNKDDNTENPHITTQEFSISSVRDSDGSKYTCRGRRSDSQLSQISDAVTLSVSENIKPEVTSGLKGAALTGNSVTLSCTLKLQSNGWTFYWNTPTQSTETETAAQYYDSFYYSNYNISSVSVSDRGQYKCRAGRGNPVYYTNYSDALWVNVIESPKPVVFIKPDTQVFRGERVTFRCDIQTGGDTEWTYSWYKNDNTGNPHRTTQELIISSVTDTDGGKYTCRGRRSDSQLTQISDAVTLSVSEKPKPTVRVNPQSSLYTGDSVTLSCELQFTGWTFLWYKDCLNSNPLPPGAQDTNTLSFTVSNEGQINYCCKAHRGNYESEFSDPATITVKARPKPVVKVQPAECVFIGESVTLTCEIQTGGSWQYHWYRDNTELSDAEGEKTHTITDVKESNKGDYTCRGTQTSDPKYTHTSDAVTLTVSGESPLVTLIISPSRTQHLTGHSLSMICEDQRDSTGWTVRGYAHNETVFDCSSVSRSICNICSLSISHTGVYWCQSESGGCSKSRNITVHNGDVILESPVHPVTEGNPLTLRCLYRNTKISNSGADFYKDDSVLQKQTTGEMTISSASKSDEGFYHCKHPERGESPKSWVSVRVPSHGKSLLSVLKLLSSVIAASPYVLVTIILAVKCYRARTELDDNRLDRVIEAEASF